MSRELHINFLCLIVLGKLWRKKTLLWQANNRYRESSYGLFVASQKRYRDSAKGHLKTARGARRYRLRHPDRAKNSVRAARERRIAECSPVYIRQMVYGDNPELRGMELPAAFIESRKEVIHAKRILRKYKRDQELGGQPSVLQNQA